MNAVVEHENTPRLPSLASGGAVKAIVPQDFEGAWRIATAVCKAGMAPKGLDTPEKAMVAIMHGLEVGLTPMNALQSIAVINSRATVWGDGALGLIQASGKLASHKEWFEGEGETRKAFCKVVRKGDPEPKIGEFSVADAKKAGLFGKAGPWQQYLDRMLKMRARAFALRDGFSDVLRGLGIAEEVQDIQPAKDTAPPRPPKPPAPPTEQIDAPDDTASEDPVAESIDADTGEIIDDRQIVRETGEDAGAVTEGEFDVTGYFEEMEVSFAAETTAEGVEERWNEFDPLAQFDGDDTNQAIALAIKKRALKQIEKVASNG